MFKITQEHKLWISNIVRLISRGSCLLAFALLQGLLPVPAAHAYNQALMCRHLPGLTFHQRNLCEERPDTMASISIGLQKAKAECEYQFRDYRWNCTTPRIDVKQSIYVFSLNQAYKESAFEFAMITAGVAHSVARACMLGRISSCRCTETVHESVKSQQSGDYSSQDRQFENNGCSGESIRLGINYGTSFVKAFESDLYPDQKLLHHHNMEFGRQITKQAVEPRCNCIGTTGSCVTKVCHPTLPDLRELGDELRKRVMTESKLVEIRRVKESYKLIRVPGDKKISKKHPAYLQESPSFCDSTLPVWNTNNLTSTVSPPNNSTSDLADESTTRDFVPEQNHVPQYNNILGIRGRQCNKTLLDAPGGCRYLCCGRGFNTRITATKSQCNCKFIWCCSVICEECQVSTHVNQCK